MQRFRFWICFLSFAAASLAGSFAADEHLDRTFKECPDCPDMVGIAGGKFVMGSPASEAGRFDNEGPQHVVTVKAFALAKYPVTVDEFSNFLHETEYQPKPCNGLLGMGWLPENRDQPYAPFAVMPHRWPAMCLDWKDARAYVAWLNRKVRQARPQLSTDPYRLPSEAEWEYAARAGTAAARWWGEDIGKNKANCNGCGSPYDAKELADVDSFSPNAFGLYGMLGNVWQWTEDCWHKSYVGAPKTAVAWTEKGCAKHVLRGGSWSNLPVFVRSSARSPGAPDGGEYDYSSLAGFRVARTLP